MISIRSASDVDVESLFSMDVVAQEQSDRREFIRDSIASGTCYVATDSDEVVSGPRFG